MTKIYIDASALVMLFYSKEDVKGIVKQLFQLANLDRVQLYFSFWAANETLAAIDRKWRRAEITLPQRMTIISTVINRVRSWSEGKGSRSNITCVVVNNDLLTKSREFILVNHISADDALHICTASAKNCDMFVFRDDNLKKQFGKTLENMRLISLADDEDIQGLFDNLDGT